MQTHIPEHMHIDGHTIHQKVENLLRHKVALIAVLSFMAVGVAKFDNGLNFLQQAYAQGFGWIGTYMHHEPHTAHAHMSVAIARIPTISGD